MNRKHSIKELLGPLLPVVGFFLAALVFLFLARICFILWKWERVSAVDGVWTVLGYGIRMDIVALCYAIALPTLLTLILPDKNNMVRGIWNKIMIIWLTVYAVLLVFMEAATPSFVDQYDCRPNRLFFEYLDHPREVFSTLFAAYKLPLLLAAIFVVLAAWGTWKGSQFLIQQSRPWGPAKRFMVLPLVLLMLFAGARSSFSHRPANMSTAAFCNDHLVNQLGVNSTYTLAYAVYRMKDESDSVRFYGEMSHEEVIKRIHQGMNIPESAFTNTDIPTLHRQIPLVKRNKPLNLVIILEESLGSSYVKSLGGLPLTPELEKLSTQGLWFTNLYATGTRSIRGIEAVITGFPPTPARSVVKLSRSQQNFFTLGRLLKEKGYSTEFIYGGDSQFDNMRGFLLSNGFERVIDEKHFKDWIFRGSWGVSDEDIFARTHQELMAHGDKPFLTFVFSVSNHSPFEFPDGRIELYEQPKNSRYNAVKYSDYALGKFFEKARKSPYWDNTVFLVVADHEDRVFGNELVPVKHFHIPALILGADIKPGHYDKVASQMDLSPTLLSLMGIEAIHPMQGHDLLKVAQDDPGRAVMQYGNNQAYMVGNQVVIHTPNKPPSQFIYQDEKLIPTKVQPELVRDSLAQAIWPTIAYKEKRYHLDNDRQYSHKNKRTSHPYTHVLTP